MRLWVVQVSYDRELSCSTHLTEKGAVVAGISDMLDFHGIDDEESARRVVADRFCGHTDEKPAPDGYGRFMWDQKELHKQDTRELWEVFRLWNECTWDNEHAYHVDVNSCMLEA